MSLLHAVNIREFYTDAASGEEKPGKKGITLSPESWEVVKASIAETDAALSASSTTQKGFLVHKDKSILRSVELRS